MKPDKLTPRQIEAMIDTMIYSVVKDVSHYGIASFYFEIELENGIKLAEKRTFVKIPKKKGFWINLIKR